MNSECAEGTGGASIKPSCRKSIHSYKENNMVRYGINDYNDDRLPVAGEGTDEVDNVMSKMARQRSPFPTRRNKLKRMNSYPQENTESTDDNSDDDTDIEEPNHSVGSTASSRLEESYHSHLLERSNQSFNHLQRSPSYHRRLSASSPSRVKPQSGSNMLRNCVIALVIGILAVLYVTQPTEFLTPRNTKHDKSTQTVNYDEILFKNNMKHLQDLYKIDDDTMLQLTTGISTIFSNMDAGSFIFVYNSETSDFDPSQFEKFINEVAYTAARYLRNSISSIKNTVLISSNLDMKEHGELIRKYRDEVDKTGVLLVKEVDSVPSNLAMAFHYYCDEYNPLVKRSAIFFTLNVANCSKASDKKSMYDVVEKCLAKKWKTVPPENMQPLLTRIVDIIIDLTRVF